jgi:pimeloyl-ACP methyl ester carboxylesterase
VIVGFLYLQFWDKVAAGLGVGKDMITYFKGEPEIKFGKMIWKYPARKRIHGRFDTVIDTMIAAEKPEEVIIISHSQGTVIAIEAIRKYSDKAALFGRGIKVRKLVTMGSPYSHIYEYYFPGDKGNKGFKIPSETDLKGKFESWCNIFRIDDFVGTVVGKEGGTWPENKPVNAGGHTGYWIDREVLAILNEQIIKP